MKYMKYQNFIETVQEHIAEELEKTVHVYPVLKNNGAIYDGLVVQDPILNISPTIYLNAYYHRYLDGVSLDDIYDDIIKTYQDNLPENDFDISLFRDFNKARKNIVMKLINAEKNQALLKEVPHILVYDLAIVFLYRVHDFVDEYASILIYHQHLKFWDVNENDLYELAMINSPKLMPYRFDSLHDVFLHITNESLPFLDDIHLNILTNHLKIFGATCMVYPNVLEKISNLYEDDLIIIPSSIHEVLILPQKHFPENYTMEELDSMIQEINETELADNEILSDHTYLYQRDTKTVIYKTKNSLT